MDSSVAEFTLEHGEGLPQNDNMTLSYSVRDHWPEL